MSTDSAAAANPSKSRTVTVTRISNEVITRRLTVKLTGRPKAADQSRGRTLFSRTRGDTTGDHGPLQRLLVVMARRVGTRGPAASATKALLEAIQQQFRGS
jgi:hypothetical protein